MPTIEDVHTDRVFHRPGERAQVEVAIADETGEPFHGELVCGLVHLDRAVARVSRSVTLPAGGRHVFRIELDLPVEAPHGYGVGVEIVDGEHVVARGSGALDVLQRWSDSPRYGFLSDFSPGTPQAAIDAKAAFLSRFHLNVVQFYDWMWRHHRLMPPTPEFEDALGRRLSLPTVQRSIAAVQARNGAAFGYGAVYGAEPDFADGHPEWVLRDADGAWISLAGLFFIMDISPDGPWSPVIVEALAEAVREMDFDGIHLDQYGFPKIAWTAAGRRVDLAEQFPPLIEAARAAIVAERADGGAIFNAVGNWPIETVATTSQDAIYIEVWPPDVTYNDLRRLIHDAKRLGGGKAVILAAYLTPFSEVKQDAAEGAEAAALLATAVIAASGGSHLLLGELNGVLCDPYYPKYATMRTPFVERLRGFYDVLVRYGEWLVYDGVVPETGAGLDLEGAPWHGGACPGRVWMLANQKPGRLIVHLINLTDQADIDWNAPRTPPSRLTDLSLLLPVGMRIDRALLVTPDERNGRPLVLPVGREGDRVRVPLPSLTVWSIVICELGESVRKG